jgi:hypothetical protein
MAIAKYKVVKEFEYEGVAKKLGEEIITRDSEGETLVEEGKVNLCRHLEPTDPEDKALIDAYREKEKGTIETREEENEVRDEATQENLKKQDEEAIEREAELAKTEEVEATEEAEKSVEEEKAVEGDEATQEDADDEESQA